MGATLRARMAGSLWLLAVSLPATAAAAGIEARMEVTGCRPPLTQESACQLRASWSGESKGLQEVAILEAVKQQAAPGLGDFRVTFRARPEELAAPSPEGFRRTRRATEFGSWLFEGKQPWTYCVKVRVKDGTGTQGESPSVCLAGIP